MTVWRDIYGSTRDVPLSQLMKQKKKRPNQDSRDVPRPKLQCPRKEQTCGFDGDELPVKSIDQAINRLDARLRPCGLVALDMPRDGSCFFHSLAWWLVNTLGRSGSRQLLVHHVVNQGTVRNFLCDWATEHSEHVIDDEGEETVRLLAIRAALHDWQTPISDHKELPEKERLALQVCPQHCNHHHATLMRGCMDAPSCTDQ